MIDVLIFCVKVIAKKNHSSETQAICNSHSYVCNEVSNDDCCNIGHNHKAVSVNVAYHWRPLEPREFIEKVLENRKMEHVKHEHDHALYDSRNPKEVDQSIHSVLVELSIVEHHRLEIDATFFICSQLFQFLFGLTRHT